ncbi:minichromosome maintenance protein MCM [Halorussus halophilus]|uniref:minichromosome maintenance protein MCM n=1 Tax=Halorussus halophilus TaxID=2650975 RepID=UPI001301846E|nr:minichromosome maintenance protein MCM [Halorussus halophilus]
MSVRNGDLAEKWYEYVYREQSDSVSRFVEQFPDERALSVSCNRFGHDYQFVRPLLTNPDAVLQAGRAALRRFTSQSSDELDSVYLRISDLPAQSEVSFEELRADHLNELHTFSGAVVATEPVRPKVVTAAFRCAKCERVTRRDAQPGRTFRDHAKCPRCSSVGYLSFAPEDSDYVDAQLVELRDSDEQMQSDTDAVPVLLEHDLAGSVSVGETVRLAGIPRANRAAESTVADFWVESVSMENLTATNQ